MKKIAIIALSFVLTAALFCGCRRNVGTETSAPSETTKPTTTPTTAPTTAPTTVPTTAPTTTPTTSTNESEKPGATGGETDATNGGKVGRNGRVRP
ncbi:MAG: hypothetical protein E7470_02380 [Ruminococcaceae bacterium]|nr:hypothetical protein [Oscillospiraceae bacterium]